MQAQQAAGVIGGEHVVDGVPPNMVQRVMGHERSTTTLDLYTRRTDNSVRILQAFDDDPGEGSGCAPV